VTFIVDVDGTLKGGRIYAFLTRRAWVRLADIFFFSRFFLKLTSWVRPDRKIKQFLLVFQNLIGEESKFIIVSGCLQGNEKLLQDWLVRNEFSHNDIILRRKNETLVYFKSRVVLDVLSRESEIIMIDDNLLLLRDIAERVGKCLAKQGEDFDIKLIKLFPNHRWHQLHIRKEERVLV